MTASFANDFAETQGDFFALLAKDYTLDSIVSAFAESTLCKRLLDVSYSPFQSQDELVWEEILLDEAPVLELGTAESFLAEFVGFNYRLLQLLTQKSTKEVVDTYPLPVITQRFYADEHVGTQYETVMQLLGVDEEVEIVRRLETTEETV